MLHPRSSHRCVVAILAYLLRRWWKSHRSSKETAIEDHWLDLSEEKSLARQILRETDPEVYLALLSPTWSRSTRR
jgi:hypothetical protein